MMHTEEEARKLWCPMARVNEDDRNITNRDQFVNGPWTGCLASQCAVWQWGEPVVQNNEKGTFHSANMIDLYPDKYTKVPEMGFCGLVKP